jgi:hypothetical protein
MRIRRYPRFVINGIVLVTLVAAGRPGFGRDKNETIEAQAYGTGNQLSRTIGVTLNVKRGNNGPSVMPGIPSAKRNGTFFAKTATTIVLMSTQKNSGFVGDPGSSSFGFHDATVGGAKRPFSVAAKNVGWYSEGACISGVVPGLCGPGRPMLLLWRQSPARHDLRPRHSSADSYACQRFVFARNQRRPSHRGNRHDLFCGSSFLEMRSDTGVFFGIARNGSWLAQR